MKPSRKNLELNLLGNVYLRLNGEPVTGLPSRAAEALLIYLAFQDRPVSRETLAEFLWADRTPKQGLTNLRTVLTALRRELGDFLVITRKEVGFNHKSSHALDALSFEHTLDELSTALQSPEPLGDLIARQLQTALDFYQGDFLEGFYLRDGRGFEEWAALERERLRRLAHSGFRRQVQYYLRQGDFPAGIQNAERLLALDPLDENSHRLMMQLLLRDGQRNAAIKQYHRCRDLLADDLGVEPSPATTSLFERLRTTPFPPPQKIPPPSTPFIGRGAEIKLGTRRIIDRECRLLSILGPGGIGKTRLAVELARRVAQTHPGLFLDGIYYISLANVSAPEYLTSTIAEVLDFKFEGEIPSQDQLLRALENVEGLFVLDNIEHLLSKESVAWIAAILTKAPGVNLVLTSRERLRLPEEEVIDLGGMSYPPPGTDLQEAASFSAMALFLQNAQRVRPMYEPSDVDLEAMIQICRLVDGMPLGIELAASGVRYFSPQEIRSQLQEKLDLDFGLLDHRPTRHQSLAAVFEHSWSLLSVEEQTIAQRFSVFSGPFDAAAAEAIAGASRGQTALLFDKSFIRRHAATGQFDLHPLMRQFLMAKMTQDPEEYHDVHRRHAEYFEQLLLPEIPSQNMESYYFTLKDGLERNMENVIAAALWQAEEHDFSERRLVNLFERIFFYFARTFRLERWKVVMNELKTALLVRADGCFDERWLTTVLDARIAYVDIRLHAQHRAQKRLEQILPEAVALGNPPLISVCHNLLSICAHYNGDFPSAFEHGNISMEVVEDYPEQFIWPIQRTLGDAAFDAGQLEKSRDLHTKAYELALNKKSGDEADSIYYLSEGRVLHRLGKTDQARENLIRALDLSQPKNEPVEIINALYNLAHLHTDEGLFLEAERLIAAAKDAAAELKDSRLTAAVAQTDGWLAWSQNDLTTAEVEFQRCLDLLNSIDDQAARPMAMVYLALVWGARGDEKARELLTEAGETFLRWDHSGGIAFTHLAWGFFYTSAGDDSAAAKALITALESALGGDEIYFAVQILVALGINLADQGDHALALSTLAYAAAHPALTHHDQALVQTQIEILQDKLTPPEYAAARDQWLEASIDIVFSRIQMGFAT